MKKLLMVLMVAALMLFAVAGCGTGEKDNGSSTGSSTTSAPSVIGDWKYEDKTDTQDIDAELDLRSDGTFKLDGDRDDKTENETEIAEDDQDAEATGTYVDNGTDLTLTMQTVQDPGSFFTGAVVQNAQIKLNYQLSKDGNTLTLTNASDAVSFLPQQITLQRDL